MKSCLNHKNFFAVSFCVAVVCVLGSTVFGQPWTGGGTAENPYQIWDANDMQAIGADANYWDAHFKLMDNIDLDELGGARLNVIGNYGNPFSGSFDGDGHVVCRFVHDGNGLSHVGLFADIDGVDARVKGLGLIDVNIVALGNWHVGGLVGRVDEGTVTGCYVSGKIVGNTYVGSLVGFNKGNVSECYGTGEVSGIVGVGGLVGQSDYRSGISTSYFDGTVSGEKNIGGLVGTTSAGAQITNCYSVGSVLGGSKVGGFVGWHGQGNVVTSYSWATVSGNESVGGLIGDSGLGGVVYLSFWDMQTSGQTTSAGGKGKTTSEMKDPKTYIGWGCEEPVWTIDAGVDYPRLIWEETPGEIVSVQLSDFVEGAGTGSEPYLIHTGEQLNLIGLFICEWDKHFKLMADLDMGILGEDEYNIVGTHVYQPFRGVFNGNGHAIFNFMYAGQKEDRIGLFGCVDDPNAEITNLVVIEPNIQAETGQYVGSLVGELRSGTISRCWVQGGSVTGWNLVGGLVGSTRIFGGPPPTWADIRECYCNVHVSGLATAGGLIGRNAYYGKVHQCYSAGDVEGNWAVGGLAGYNDGNIADCYAQGGISGQEYVGGLVGKNGIANISRCYSTGEVTGGEHVGGLVGENIGPWGGTIMSSFWDVNTSSMNTSDGGTAKTTAEMQTKSTFTSAGWDFTTPIWTIAEGVDYPRLWWENAAPVACIVGGDRTIEVGIGCEARVTLDGSCSSDADSTPGTNDDINDFDWYEQIDPCDPNSDIFLGNGEIIECNLPLGEHDIVLEVIDKAGAFDVNEVTITVEDTTPPELSLTVEPSVLWPANHKMVEITSSWEVSDNCDEWPEVTLVNITINEDGATEDDIQIGDEGIWLRAERSGIGDGRIYTITYRAVDDSGNVSIESAAVTVPHDKGKR